jgi:hypothetical protein
MRGSVSVRCNVEVELADVLAELSVSDLLAELRRRNQVSTDYLDIGDFSRRARECIQRSTLAEALDLLAEIVLAAEPMPPPKLKASQEALQLRDPVTGQPVVA